MALQMVIGTDIGGGGTDGGAVASLRSSLTAYWKLEEPSGNRIDATGLGSTLSPTNAPGNAAGKIGNALNLVLASAQYLSCANNSRLQINGSALGWTMAAWVQLASKPVTNMVITNKTVATQEFTFRWVTSDRFSATIYDGAVTSRAGVTANTFGAPALSTWYYVMTWFDRSAGANGTLYISVNNGVADSAALSGAAGSSNNTFFIGSTGGGQLWDGLIDEVAIWQRVLTPAERTALYNAGSGLALY